jgi:Protein of unknown function (DUF1538)
VDLVVELLGNLAGTALSVVLVAAFLLFFYRVVLRQKLAHPAKVLIGLGFVVVGLALFLQGLDKALFPVGRMMVEQLTANLDGTQEIYSAWRYYPVYVFAFCIAFSAAFAEPALLAVAHKVNDISGGAIQATGLRIAAALGVALGVTFGCVRIVTGFPLPWCLAAIFMIVISQTFTAPRAIIGLAYDTGAVSTTAVTVPVVTALGLALAAQVPGRSPIIDGFGLISLACLFPAVTVLAYAQIAVLTEKRRLKKRAAARMAGSTRKTEN